MPGLVGTVVKQYHIQRLLGSGGMSEVYLAYDEVTEQYVAVKVMTGYAADYLERFRREAEAIDKLQHPHILPALDYEECEPWHMLVMLYAPGGTLRDVLTKGPLDPDEAGVLFEQIASAVQFAHDNGVLHRDIKPSNILLRDRSHAYLADFGLAKLVDATGELTRTGVLMGTPEYMAPDLATAPATVSTDVYSLGILLYQMLTARLPFEAETPVAVFWKQLHDEPLPPSLHNPTLTRAIDRVVLRALTKDPTRRYTSAIELAQAYKLALLASIEEEIHSSSLNLDVKSEYEPVVLADSVSLPDSVLVHAEAPAVSEPPRRRRRDTLFSPARRMMTSRPVLPVVARRRATRRARRLAYATPAVLDPDSSMPQSPEAASIHTETLAPRRRRRIRGRSPTVTERPHKSSRATRRTHIVPGIIGAGILLFIILPLSVMYYLYATRPIATVIGNAHSVPVASSPQSVGRINSKTAPPAAKSDNPAASGPLLLQDDLTSNTNGRWSEAPGSCSFAYGSYRVMHSPGSAELPCALISPLIGDASVQVNASLLSGDTVDMLLRLRGEQYYMLQLNSAGQISFLRHDAGAAQDQYVTLLKPTASSAIVPGSGINTLLVQAQGSDFKFYVNGIFLGEVRDANYKSGQLAFQVNSASTTEQAIASFTHFKLSAPTP
ncbi:serine/threonine-protein kinase [Dictyobacter aurantiacus]|uniref:non-specific serine/threonine protein kinase n=1 Tax=Dictyobacter aurantiacus TaxID=1936993 RepID=A0A401ZDY8_9CHLR|nr:serine/threonine-protein kinase [Dictyobacter aurantiacus]GCE05049.1 hypothetical protein KDAU_23780 [Dictyobacter aurantiacus]